MSCRRALGRQRRVLTRSWVCAAQLVELPPHVLLLALPSRAQLLEIANPVAGLDPGRMTCCHCASHLHGTRIPIEQLGLRLAVEERVVLMLAVKGDKASPELTELPRAGGPPIDSGRAALAELALEH